MSEGLPLANMKLNLIFTWYQAENQIQDCSLLASTTRLECSLKFWANPDSALEFLVFSDWLSNDIRGDWEFSSRRRSKKQSNLMGKKVFSAEGREFASFQDPRKNCKPVDCVEKYNGWRNFFRTSTGKCESTHECYTKGNKDEELPEIVSSHDIQWSICCFQVEDIKTPWSGQVFDQFSKGACVRVFAPTQSACVRVFRTHPVRMRVCATESDSMHSSNCNNREI